MHRRGPGSPSPPPRVMKAARSLPHLGGGGGKLRKESATTMRDNMRRAFEDLNREGATKAAGLLVGGDQGSGEDDLHLEFKN